MDNGRERELKFPKFPKMLYRRTMTPAGKMEPEERIVNTAAEEDLAEAAGWFDNPQVATEAAIVAYREQQDHDRQAADRHLVELFKKALAENQAASAPAVTSAEDAVVAEDSAPVPAPIAPPDQTTNEGPDTAADRSWFEPLVRQRSHTINSLAAKVECNSGTLYKWRDGRTGKLRTDVAEKVAKELGVDPKVFA